MSDEKHPYEMNMARFADTAIKQMVEAGGKPAHIYVGTVAYGALREWKRKTGGAFDANGDFMFHGIPVRCDETVKPTLMYVVPRNEVN